jgi:V/A-type H+-transporting ATPase subunit K
MLVFGSIVLALLMGILTLIYTCHKKENITGKMKKACIKTLGLTGLFSILILSVGMLSISSNRVFAQDQTSNQTTVQETKSSSQNQSGSGFIAAALAVGIGSLGAGIAVGMAGAAAIGAISENPKMFGSAIVFVAMGEGIAIYGIVIAILILARI